MIFDIFEYRNTATKKGYGFHVTYIEAEDAKSAMEKFRQSDENTQGTATLGIRKVGLGHLLDKYTNGRKQIRQIEEIMNKHYPKEFSLIKKAQDESE